MKLRAFVALAMLAPTACRSAPEPSATSYRGIEKMTITAKGME